MDLDKVRTDIRIDLVAFSEPLASKRFHHLDEAVDWALGAAAKLRTAFEPDVFRQLDKALRISIEMTIGARDYSHHCKVWSGPLSAAETTAARAAQKFIETALPAETAAAQNAALAAEKRRVRKSIAIAVAGAAMCAILFGVLRALPPVFDTEVQAGRVLSAPPEPLGGAWAGSNEACQQGRVVFARGKIELFSGAGFLSYPATYERLEGGAIKVSFLAGGVRVTQIVKVDPHGSSLVVQRVDVSEGVPRAMAVLAAGTRLVRCR
jgi:hypothetical protein